MTKREIFLQAQACESAAERDRFLAEACGTDGELRADIESLLGFDREDAFLEAPAVEPADSVVGTMIGPYL